MKRRSENTTTVQVSARDGLTEISIIDSRFNKVATGFGFLSKDLTPGIYKVRWKTASASDNKLIEITGNEEGGVLDLEGKIQEISTSAPLGHTKFGRFDRSDFLKELSINPPVQDPDKTSQLLVFLRDEEGGNTEFPAQSVSLHSPDGMKLADFSAGLINSEERYAGFMIGLDPGVYRLRVETQRLGTHEIFISTVDGWQTRVFLTCGDFFYGSDSFRRPMLRTTSILMGIIGTRFDSASHDARLAEIALNALRRGVNILASKDMRGLLHGKFSDPMLGIYSAHLLLLENRIRWNVFETVCSNLYRLVGPIPDLQALYIRSKNNMRDYDERLIKYHGLPPMLIQSWDLLVKSTRRRFSIIPLGSLSDRIAGTVVSTKPWLMCRVDPNIETNVQSMQGVSYALGGRVIKQMVEKANQTDKEAIITFLEGQQEQLNPIESAILSAVIMPVESESSAYMQEWKRIQLSEAESSNSTPEIEAFNITKNALSNLQVPSYSLARSAVSLATKLKGKFDIDIS